MDVLDEQLEQLKLINSRSLSPRSNKLSGQMQNSKKVGPAVPPKPNKKNFSQVPQSCISAKPSYSQRLQSDPNGTTTSTGTVHRKHLDSSSHHVYSNMKMTLDNPAILEQQLEALEHHKKQLEKKGMLPVTGEKVSAISTENGMKQNSAHEYSNVLHTPTKKDSDIVYSNILHHNKIPQPIGFVDGSDGSELVYSNVGFGIAGAVDELPPPPPADNINVSLSLTDPNSLEYLHHTSEDELPPPPSPVSSSYSELRRATDNFPQLPSYPMQAYNSVVGGDSIHSAHSKIGDSTDVGAQQTYINTAFHNDYSTYGPSSQSSTYESIYEPINPRPPSQLSSRSNYSLYTSYMNGPQSTGSGTPVGTATSSGSSGKLSNHKEAEVEALTDLLVHSMGSGADVDTYGICVKCGERVIGENSGCTAMEQIYHIACFTCSQCQINLQGKPFYALEGKPYCEEDYLNTLEKCSVCMKPILERILRATGKPYHPQCFCCVVCGNSLDGIPFTVDATNQNYCIEDFHKKFAPRCCVCRQPIMPELGQEETVRVVALDRSFHFECYKCEDCGLLLSSEAEGRGCYPLDDHVLCKSCNARRVQALTSHMTTEL